MCEQHGYSIGYMASISMKWLSWIPRRQQRPGEVKEVRNT